MLYKEDGTGALMGPLDSQESGMALVMPLSKHSLCWLVPTLGLGIWVGKMTWEGRSRVREEWGTEAERQKSRAWSVVVCKGR